MSHPRVEEASDSDSDPSEGDIEDLDFDDSDIIKARAPPTRIYSLAPADPSKQHPAAIPANFINPSSIPSSSQQTNSQARAAPDDASQRFIDPGLDPKYKTFQCIYPVYFDKNRSRQEGRRVGLEGAVENPLAKEISAACARLGLETLFEPEKSHPKDWSNPGRVKVKLKGGRAPSIKNKAHLFTLISRHLIANPTTTESAASLKIRGLPGSDPTKPYPEPAIPKGWKMNKILPYISPAMTGGGVSENFFKDMMGQMQGAGMDGIPGMPGPAPPAASGSGKPKKEKRKIIRG